MSRGVLLSKLFLVFFVLFAFANSGAWAQDSPSSQPACPTGNLLAHKAPTAWQDTRRELSLLTDETVAPEGAVWDASLATIFDTGAATVTWDLGEVTKVRLLAVQADANDTYNVWGSIDGKDYKLMGQIDPANGHGLRMRTLDLGAGMAARFLRVGEGKGDSFYSISEVTAYCQTPTPFPPQMKVADAPTATANKTYLDYWNNDTAARWEMILAMLGAILLWWERRLVGKGMDHVKRRLRKILLGTMGVLAFLTFFNFGFWHFPGFVHGWDTFHYFIGAKYFKELHYERLYECVAIADAEDPLLRRRVELRKLTNLRTNMVETTADILAHPERCKQHFSPERWSAFTQDIRHFRTQESARRWDDTQADHGFNGTPVWGILGTILTNLAPPASHWTVIALDSIDVIMITIMAGLLWWAFGWRTVSVALMVFATNYPSRWTWTGGSYLRWDWLFWMGAGVCLVKKEKYLWAGAIIAYAALLRIFPGFLFVAPLIALVVQYVKTRTWDRRFVRLFAGAAMAVALLVPVSFATSGGPSIYPEFIRNTAKHSGTPLTNHMGLRTVVAFRPTQTADRMNAPSMTDPWQRWKQARLKAFHESMPLYVSLVICYLVLIGLAIRGVDPWVTVALSSTVIAFGSELTCYYYAFLIIPALLYAVVPRAGEWLLWLTALTQFIGWAPIERVPKWLQNLMPASMRDSPAITSLGMPKGLDEQYTWMSFATLIVFVLIAWDLHLARKKAAAPIQAIPPVKDEIQGPTKADDKAAGSAVSTEAISPEAAPRSQGAGRKRKRKRR